MSRRRGDEWKDRRAGVKACKGEGNAIFTRFALFVLLRGPPVVSTRVGENNEKIGGIADWDDLATCTT